MIVLRDKIMFGARSLRLSIIPIGSAYFLKNSYSNNLISYCESPESSSQNKEINSKNFDQIEFERFENERIIRLYGEVNDSLGSIIINCLEVLDNKNNQPIKLIINSVGGSISQGLAICDKMNKIKSDVHTQCEGECSSIASLILANGTKGKRSITPNSTVFIHEAYTSLGGSALSIFELNGRLQSLKIHRDQIIQILIKVTGKDRSEIEELMRNDTTFTSNEAVNHNIVDFVEKDSS